MLDEEHSKLPQSLIDHNFYHLGSIGGLNVVIAGLWQAGNPTAATVVAQMRMTFSKIRFSLLVGIGGGFPVVTEHGMIRLGHVVVSKPVGLYSGAIQYDHGKAETGTIASGELVIKDAAKRDLLGQEYGVLCFEMEGAGVLSDFPCLVIRGISDYCDSDKNDQWHGLAAAAAAAYARELFFYMPIDQINPSDDQERKKIADWISPTNYATFQADFYDQRQEGTGQWLLNTAEFREWVQNKEFSSARGFLEQENQSSRLLSLITSKKALQ
ncbi:5'-methylthioadenosine/S-adenosylhomocysteine nucleosidase family protein [Aspergillus affinis]|uniref:5'-methylthioadenosine/S-adenosylhomocysteine nucleosidase family protein n=1 Tax=Aspergillus affinis TaxID=1070780 RepID=UPI0022FE4BEA|nr:NB-ARC and TPR domain protein [Aspergillus affinis]KAI9045980.1 NB-ARC and TPR domain protein [Aspergillus affinis]